jgi:FtsH-binding integral membrane protein
METIRQKLTRKRRRLFSLMLLAFVVFATGMTLGTNNKAFILIGLLGFVAAMAAVLGLLFWIRCPLCKGNLGYALSWPATWDMSVSKQIKYCQFCGVSLDKENNQVNRIERN